MNQEILKFSLGKGILLDKETLALLSNFDDNTARDMVEKISLLQEKVITRAFIEKNADKIQNLLGNKEVIDKLKISFGLTLEISRESRVEKSLEKIEQVKSLGNIKVIYSLANLSRKISPDDFVQHYRNRYNQIKRFLQDRKELENLTSITKISGDRQAISIIGIVSTKRITKNKNILLEVEDLTGKITVLINKTKLEVYEKAKDIISDDIIGIKGFGSSEILFANDVIYPDSRLAEKSFIDRDEKAAFISDIHVGSKMFLEKNFLKFIDWINGEVGGEKQREEAKKVKYLFITGDTIDGIGIFPGQEELLTIKDIVEQYNKLAFYLGKIRKDIKIILCPGQHDSVRVAEPQPVVGKDFGAALYEIDNLILVSNPAIIEITNQERRGVKILMYHGASMNSYINELDSLRQIKAHDFPSKVVKEMLKRRHLASIHGSVTYIPTEKIDPLVISEVPDIINTADLHKPDIDLYNNILIICSSCWQSMTPFEEKVGNHPDPCKVPVLNLKTREIKILDFSDSPEDKVCEEKEGKIECEAEK